MTHNGTDKPMKEEVPPHQEPLTAIKELAGNILKKVDEMGSDTSPEDGKEIAQHLKEYAEQLLGEANKLTEWVERAVQRFGLTKQKSPNPAS